MSAIQVDKSDPKAVTGFVDFFCKQRDYSWSVLRSPDGECFVARIRGEGIEASGQSADFCEALLCAMAQAEGMG